MKGFGPMGAHYVAGASHIVHLLGYLLSTGAAFFILEKRARDGWLKGHKRHSADMAAPSGPSNQGSFLKAAGLALLVLDLVVSVFRISDICIHLAVHYLRAPWLQQYEYVSGLAVETSFLQALWLLHTHTRIVACVRQRQIKVSNQEVGVRCEIPLHFTVKLGPLPLTSRENKLQVRRRHVLVRAVLAGHGSDSQTPVLHNLRMVGHWSGTCDPC